MTTNFITIVGFVACFMSGYWLREAWQGLLLEIKHDRNDRQRCRPTPLPMPQIPAPGVDQTPRNWSLLIEPSVDRLNTVITVKGIWHELPPEELGELLTDVGKYLQGFNAA
ncbi:MAG: hypothetical protein KAX55_05690 [Propionivibrio sp.]|nr:hypothetical protein [Propionivibrio sp.]MBP8932558.1 hypothetical protein [Paracoccus sp. (in: a-proteobacteria)]